MNRQIFGPELEDERREELDTLEELDTPAELEDPGGPPGPPLEPPRVVWDERDEFDDAGDLDELGERDELDGGGIVIETEDMALPSRDADRTDCVSPNPKRMQGDPSC